MRTDTPQTIYLKDYAPPLYLISAVDLVFCIYDGVTIVRSKLQIQKNHHGKEPLFLNGEHLILKSILLDGKTPKYQITENGLIITDETKDTFTLEVETEICPEKNTALEGLYQSGGNYCTQCEAQGFRRITYFIDRPDVMSTYTVRLEADKKSCPVLLSNGDLIEEGSVDEKRHFAVWKDTTPKPCYLFALVAGNLEYVQDFFTTMSGNRVDLRIYVRKGDEAQCEHAMQSLIKSMKWDEDVYGREYQYKRFNIVAVSDFNMGAMENTSLNIFNTALVLAHQETATDDDYIRVESVIAHEYFHNWTGNRVTCRDWFQLSLKEGLTVFRDQEFSSDMNSRSVCRIDDVTHLRRLQFPEDAGPLSHPVRPDNYIEINNFYTMTVYEKGAEVIRMFHTLLGSETYRKATDLYFDRFDGMAVTCDDWAQCMEDASGLDLSQFKLWYSQAGTPEVTAQTQYDSERHVFTLKLTQVIPDTPGQGNKKPMHIPVAFGLIGPKGEDLIGTQIIHLKEREQVFTFDNIPSRPTPSILRNFSAPVKLTSDLTNDDLRFLMVHDSDGFNRWESGQTYMLRLINQKMDEPDLAIEEEFFASFLGLLERTKDSAFDKALLARSLTLPDIPIISQTRDVVDPDAIFIARNSFKRAIASRFETQIASAYTDVADDNVFSVQADAMAKRALKNVLLGYLDSPILAKSQYDKANNMTDRVASLRVLSDKDDPYCESVFQDFYNSYKSYPLVIDKWFSLQSTAQRDDIIVKLAALRIHSDFNIKNPNRARSLFGAFAMNNPVCFHNPDGSGYNFLKEAVKELNAINPQIAARLLTPLREWKRYTLDRQKLMQSALQDIVSLENLSPDVFEIASKSLNE